MQNDFETEDMKKVFSNILLRLQESEENPFNTDISVVEKPNEKSTETDTPDHLPTNISDSSKKSTKKICAKKFVNTTLARMECMAKKSQENIKKKQELKVEKEIQKMKKKPEINSNSKKLFKRSEPVHERAEKE